MCHLILFMPVLALPVFWLLPTLEAAVIYSVVVVLSGWLYLSAMRAMWRPVATGREEMIRSTGEVVEVKQPLTRVRVHSELWNAESSDELHEGDCVRVMNIEGLTLKVQRVDPGAPGVLSAD